MNAIEIKNLTKSFPGFTLNNLNLTLPGGCILGLIGENGAGKSTTIKLILDIIHKDSGSITILGRDNTENIRLTKEEVGVVMDEIGLPECLTVPPAGKVMAHTFRSWDPSAYQALVRRMDLPEKKPFKDFSRGMRGSLRKDWNYGTGKTGNSAAGNRLYVPKSAAAGTGTDPFFFC